MAISSGKTPTATVNFIDLGHDFGKRRQAVRQLFGSFITKAYPNLNEIFYFFCFFVIFQQLF